MNEKEQFEYSFEDRLVIKLIGKLEAIQRHIILLKRIYPPERLNFSPILKNRGADGFHCFINILMEPGKNDAVEVKKEKEL
jgi:hypothetical protein